MFKHQRDRFGLKPGPFLSKRGISKAKELFLVAMVKNDSATLCSLIPGLLWERFPDTANPSTLVRSGP